MKIAFRKSGVGYTGYKKYTNVVTAWWTGGAYTHSELVFSDGVTGSAWFDQPGLPDGVHLIKRGSYDPELWELVPVHGDEAKARRWFEQNLDKGYNLIGAFSNFIRPLRGDEKKYFCSQAVAAALGWKDPWRYDPNLQHAIVTGVTNIVDKDTDAINTVLSAGFKKGKSVSQNGTVGHQYVLEEIGVPVVDEPDAEGSEPSAAEDLEAWLEGSAEKVRRNVVIETPESLGFDYLLHVSTNTNIRKFVPLIGRRQAPSEDRTVPRICVAPSLLGCFIGYAQAHDDFRLLPANGVEHGYKGGWKIYGFKYEATLRPNAKLVYDANMTDEMWLTAYNAATAEYVPEAMGKVFLRSMRLIGRSGKTPVAEMEMFVEVSHAAGVMFSKNIFLEKGYWVIDGPMQQNVRSWKTDKDFAVRQIERNEYLSAKAAHADLLALPVSLLW